MKGTRPKHNSPWLLPALLAGFDLVWLFVLCSANATGKGGVSNLNLVSGIIFIMLPVANLILGVWLFWSSWRIRSKHFLFLLCGLIAAIFPWALFGYLVFTGKLAW